MIKDIKQDCNELKSFIQEIKTYDYYKQELINNLKLLDRQYQRGDFNYRTYMNLKNELLLNKSKSECMEYYNSYIDTLLKKADSLNTKLLSLVYNDNSYRNLKINKKILLKKAYKVKKLPGVDSVNIYRVKEELPGLPGQFLKKAPEKKEQAFKPVALEKPEHELALIKIADRYSLEIPRPEPAEKLPVPPPRKLGFLRNLAYAFQSKEKPILDKISSEDQVKVGGVLSKDFLKYLLGKKKPDKEFISDKTSVMPSIFTYKQQEVGNIMEEDVKAVLDPYLLEKEVKEIKELISMKKTKIYEPSSLGYLANITVRKISIYFIEKFPNVFKKLYLALRYANFKILSNTYINIMFLLTIFSFIVTIPVFALFFAIQGNATPLIILKSLLFSMLLSVMLFAGLFYYPFMEIKNRRRSINTNLPFAIDHMSSVIASGVPPTTMFKLLSASKEYGQISVEMEKISNYIEVFGYDALTAIRAISVTTPSSEFKEFLDGFVSTIETGGDIKNYLEQKSKEALLHYRLERQKYVESISTYSDIYTGVLIAAPLFFVTALSLVSMLGGNVGGIDINVIITIGTYLVIPMLNVLFIVFLEMNQPEI